MNWIGFEGQSVIATIIGFAILAYIIFKSFRKRRIVLTVILCLLVLSLLNVNVSYAQTQEDQQLQYSFQPQTYRFGDLAVVPIIFPFSIKSYEAVWVNETGNLTAIWQEKLIPTTWYNPVFIQIAVFNATKDNPVYLWIDDVKYEFTSEGVYSLLFNLSETVHCFMLSCKYKIFIRSLVDVKNIRYEKEREVSFSLAYWQDLLLRFGMYALLGACVGAYSAIEVKRKVTKITTYYAYLLAVPLFVAGYLFRLGAVFTFSMVGAYAVTYWLCKDYANIVLLLKAQKHKISSKKLLVDDEGYEISWKWEKYKPKMVKREVEYVDYYPLDFDLADVGIVDCVFYKEIKQSEDKITVVCDKGFMQALVDAKIVEKLDKRLNEIEIENNFLRKAMKSTAMQIVSLIEKQLETTVVDKAKSFEKAIELTKKEVKKIETPKIEEKKEGEEVEQESKTS